MDNYKELVKAVDTKVYKVDLAEIVTRKHIIPMQYETINIGGNSDDLHELCRKLDRYLLHIIEEIAEFLEEIDNIPYMDRKHSKILYPSVNSDNTCLMELIDVAAYISSILSILYIDLYNLDKVKEGKFDSTQIINMADYDATYSGEESVKNIINDVLMKVEKILLLNVRRKFPERKWHKDTDRILSITELYTLYIECIENVSNALCETISLFLFLTGNDCTAFNNMFLDKNDSVYSLKK